MAFRASAVLVAIVALVGGSLRTYAAPVDIPLGAEDRITLKGFAAQVSYNVNANPGARQLRVSGLEEAGWVWQKEGSRILLLGPEGDSRRSLEEQMRNPGRRAVIEITGSSAPIEIHLREGAVNLNRGQHGAVVNLRNGKVTAIGRTGSLKTQVMKGEVFVSDGSGQVVADVYDGKLTLRNLKQLEGEAALFSGQLMVENAGGHLSLVSSQATTKVQKFSGTLNIENGKGSWSGTAIEGRVEGQSDEGAMSVQVKGESDVNLKSHSGRITVELPKTSGANLNLRTQEGDLRIPGDQKIVRNGSEKSFRGRLKGEAGKMSVTIRSQEGSILIR